MSRMLLLAWLVLVAMPAYAGEVKVVDRRDLVRAVRVVSSRGTVRVEVSGDVGRAVASISNVDGVAADVKGTLDGSSAVVFRGVSDGTWRLNLADGIEVMRVTISDE